MSVYDIAVIGAGPAGMMAAIRAGQLKKNVLLIERNASCGKKMLLTGKGRCNITNIAPIETFIEKFGKQGLFLRPAFLAFFNQDLIDFFESAGLKLKIERQGRVFPVTDKVSSVMEVLKGYLSINKVKILYNTRLIDIKKENTFFELEVKPQSKIYAKKVILATGGMSYKITGSTGDGFNIAKRLNHIVTPLKPGLVPLKVKERWVRQLQGLSLRNVRITLKYGKKIMTSDIGELIFTHFGISGPLVLDLSNSIVHLLEGHKEIQLFIDLKPGLNHQQVNNRLLREFLDKGDNKLKTIMNGLLPKRLIPVVMHLADLDPEKKANQTTRNERHSIVCLLKAMPLTVVGSLYLEEAMVTSGGISTSQIDPRTMESKVVPGLYFAGEIIDGCASSGGYNLQQAFSTGFLAGEKASCAG